MQNEDQEFWDDNHNTIEYVQSEIDRLIHSPLSEHSYRREVNQTLAGLDGLLDTIDITTTEAKAQVSRLRKQLRDSHPRKSVDDRLGVV